MHLKVRFKREASRRNIALLALLLLAVGLLYYQNILGFQSYYSAAAPQSQISEGAPLLSAGDQVSEEEAARIQEEARIRSTPAAAKALEAPAAALGAQVQAKSLATETYQEKGVLQEPYLYYGAIAILGLMLLLNIFKVSFQSSAVFDSDIFKTLSSDTRVEMLYALQERRKTLSELATQANISLPGAKQHLTILESKGLVKKMDEGRKWKYYELTDQGKSILAERYA